MREREDECKVLGLKNWKDEVVISRKKRRTPGEAVLVGASNTFQLRKLSTMGMEIRDFLQELEFTKLWEELEK